METNLLNVFEEKKNEKNKELLHTNQQNDCENVARDDWLYITR